MTFLRVALQRLLRNHVLGGATIPEHWIGGGGEVNRTTADSMGEPTLKIWTMRQDLLRHMLVEVGTWVVHSRLDPSRRSIPDPADETIEPPEAEFPEMSPQDNSRYAAALGQVAAACALAEERGFVDRATAARLIGAAAERLGVSYDPAEILALADAEAKARRKARVQEDIPPPPEPEELRKNAQEEEAP
ncbi:hypothetical protein [Neomegalonema sp.]|uniref:hypothetical protein n=1 Tax=Neomegalonema sp. TaxID=2039713 RepID=UPI00260AC9B0|nr:hypothetical protein [Neomegalonema sp.]MDD2869706.1 hypothetical protein [Neomegalonema sp.]